MSKGFEELKESSLEDVYHYLCKNEPSKKSKKHEEWDCLESIAYEELLNEEEHPNDCTRIINEIVDYLERQWKCYVVLYDTEKEREFRKGFDTEFERDKFIRKLRYSSKIKFVRKEEY